MASDSEASSVRLEEPRMEDRKSLLVAGMMKNYSPETASDIPSLWKEVSPQFGKIPGQVGGKAYGVVYNTKNAAGFAYLAGVEVSSASDVPDELNVVRIPDMTYAVFSHEGHVSTLKDKMAAIYKWLPESGLKLVQVDEEMPDMLEQYGEGFNPKTGMGEIEVWVPIKNRTRTITFDSAPEA